MVKLAALEGLGFAPIASAAPEGADVRDDPLFEALQAELAKLATPGADGQTDWSRMADLAAQLLADKGKDLLVASYLAAALLHSDGLPGLAAGLEVLGDLIEHYWSGMFPPLARLRGRRNALQWLLDRIDLAAADEPWTQRDPQDPELVTRLRTQSQRIDALLRERDEEAPPLRGLLALIDSLPVREPPPAPAAAELPSAPPPPAGATGSESAPVPAFAAFDGDLEGALVQVFDHLNLLADRMMDGDIGDARAYRASRFANWAGVQALPPATNGQTQIPPPIMQVVDALHSFRGGGAEPGDAIRFAEAQLPAFPFWLDLQHLCATALARGGEAHEAARAEVEDSTRRLVARLPGLEALSFASGMPFADGDTVRWLDGLSAGAQAGLGTSAGAPRGAEVAMAQARSLASNGEIEAAAALMQKAIDEAPDAAAGLRARIQLAALLTAHQPGRVPAAFAQAIVEQVERHALAAWDPALAVEGLAAAYEILRQDDALADAAGAALSVVARLDAARALRLRG